MVENQLGVRRLRLLILKPQSPTKQGFEDGHNFDLFASCLLCAQLTLCNIGRIFLSEM